MRICSTHYALQTTGMTGIDREDGVCVQAEVVLILVNPQDTRIHANVFSRVLGAVKNAFAAPALAAAVA